MSHSRKANFSRLFKWRFNKKRVREVRKNWKNKYFKDFLDKQIFNYELGCDDYDVDLLSNHIPLFGETISDYSMQLYRALEEKITLNYGGMGGANFRHTLEDVAKLLKRDGFKYKFVKEFVLDFESRIYKEYIDESNKE